MRKPWFVVPFLVGGFYGALGLAQTPLERMQKFIEDTKPATLSDIPENTSWAGRCVATASPRRIFGVMLNFYNVKDTVLDNFVFAVAVKNGNANRYYTITGAEAQKVRDEVDKTQLEFYSELAQDGDDLKTSFEIPEGKAYLKEDEAYAAGKSFSHGMELRVKKNLNQPPMFALKISCNQYSTCPGMGYGASDAEAAKGDIGVYCYIDKKVLPLPPVVVKPVNPKPVDPKPPVKPDPPKPVKPKPPVTTDPIPEPTDPSKDPSTKGPEVKDDGSLD